MYVLLFLVLVVLIVVIVFVFVDEVKKFGMVFKDCKDCLEMVVLFVGSFIMGILDDEVGCQFDEGLLYDVIFVKLFVISCYQVIVGELDVYLKVIGVKLVDGDICFGCECIVGKLCYQ